jgi:hypothetical protein
MDGAGSRNKGNAYERKISKILSKHYPPHNLRRVPSSGGLDIKCDIYDPQNDSFPLFVECKHRKTFSLQTIMGGSSELFDMFDKIERDCEASYLQQKYVEGPKPVVIFKGGDFREDMIAFRDCDKGYLNGTADLLDIVNKIVAEQTIIITLKSFLRCSNKKSLKLRAT